MLIKYYSKDQSLIIIDGICDISVPSFPAHGEYASENYKVYDFDNCFKEQSGRVVNPELPHKIIEFSKDAPCILKVYGTAYICNDDGKTIEKVEALSG